MMKNIQLELPLFKDPRQLSLFEEENNKEKKDKKTKTIKGKNKKKKK